MLLGLVNSYGRCPICRDVSKTAAGIKRNAGVFIAEDGGLSRQVDTAALHVLHVPIQHPDAVRVNTQQRRLHLDLCSALGDRRGRSQRLQHAGDELLTLVCVYGLRMHSPPLLGHFCCAAIVTGFL